MADLATALGFSEAKLLACLRRPKQYSVFTIPKRSGGTRTISKPSGVLLEIQKRLNTILQQAYGRRSTVHGFVYGRSCITNAERHLDARLIFNCDIRDFFPSIHFGRVRGLFESAPYNYPRVVAQVIARICCHNGSLPQGAPTSPVISNMVCGKLDAQLKDAARQFRCRYTRYADDITFSTDSKAFADAIVTQNSAGAYVPGVILQQILSQNRFSINATKTRLALHGSRKEVTGVILGDKGLNVRRSFVKQIRCMLHSWERYGEDAASATFIAQFDDKNRSEVSISNVVRGKIEYVGQVRGRDNEVYFKLAKRFVRLRGPGALRPISITKRAELTTTKRAVFVIEATKKNGLPNHATAFFLAGVGLITAYHAICDEDGQLCTDLKIYKTSAHLDGRDVTVERVSQHHDIAVLRCDVLRETKVELQAGSAVQAGSPVRILGYPRFGPGADVSVIPGHVIRTKVDRAVRQIITDALINEGNSGGPVLNHKNEVVAIAVKGKNETDNTSVLVSHCHDTVVPTQPVVSTPTFATASQNQRIRNIGWRSIWLWLKNLLRR